jgi:endoglucanase
MTCESAIFKLGVALVFCSLGVHSAQAWQSDNGDGTFKAPVLYADYPDPDIIRVTNDFYMVSTTFVDNPGINVLHSKDLVNWEIASHVATNLDGGNAYNMIGGTAYRGGFWASSIRYYNGTFYVVANPTFANSRIYYTSNIAGSWQYYQLNQVTYDPGFLIDTDGKGYIVCGHGPESVCVLNANFSQITGVSNNLVNATGEGSHVVKRGSYYYVFTAYPGTWPYQLLCSRATNIFGPYETNHVCLNEISGGHQGGIVDMPDGSDYDFVMKDSGAVGRMTYICPIYWTNGWPVWGTSNAPGQVPAVATKPIQGQTVTQPATSDDFTNSTLGLQWQWNHNPDNTRWSLSARPGWLRLMPTPATNFWVARNTLTQEGQGPWSRGEVKLDISHLQAGDICGFGTLGMTNGQIAVNCDGSGNKYLSMNVIAPADNTGTNVTQTSFGWVPVAGSNLYLRVDLDFQSSLGTCSYSFDDTNWATLGGQFNLAYDIGVSTFQGEKYAIFCYNANPGTGYVDVDWFHFSDNIQRARPRLNAARTSFVADNGQLLRGPFTSTEWTGAVPAQDIANMKSLGFNAVHLYAETFDLNYPNTGSTAPGYSVANVDAIVAATRTNGLYLVITIGNGANNGSYNLAWATNFWNFYAPRYANETHVLYEIHNEPVAWGPSYLTAQSPPGALNMEIACYNIIRANAPNTPVLLFTYAVFGGTGGTSAALTDIGPFNGAVFGNTNAVWTNEVVGFHGYARWQGTATAVAGLLSAGYPCMMTEFGGGRWGGGSGLDVEMVAQLERMGVSWLTFQHVPPTGVSDDVSQPEHYKNLVDNSGLSWNPDYGNWPPARGVYGNGGLPWTTPDFTNNFLSGTLHIEAENFDTGGKGVAYYNGNTANLGGKYRTNDTVSIETTSDTGGGYDVTSTAAGDWLEYTMMDLNAGMYELRLRIAGTPVGSVQALEGGVDLTGPWALPSTGGSQTWRTVTNSVFLAPGQLKLRINVLAGGFNLNWIELSPASTGAIANGTYKFLNAANSLTLQGDTGSVLPAAYSGVTTQQWNLQHTGGSQYKVTSVGNGWNWIYDGSLGMVWWWGAGGNQSFIVLPTGGGYYRIVPANSGLTVETTATPTNIDQRLYSGSANQQWAIVAPSAPAIPTGLSALAVSPTQIALTWNAATGATSYNVKRSATSGGPYTTIATGVTSTNYTDAGTAGVRYYYVASAISSGAEGPNSLEATVALPYPWMTQDVGSVGLTGSAAFGNGVFTVTGSGDDIWNATDAFRFVYVPVTGNCTMVARVVSVQNVDQWSKAGVMIRESLAANAVNAFIAVTPGNGVTWQYRSSTGGGSNFNNATGLSAPYWVKLVRNSNTFTGYRSPDGTNWTQLGSASFTMASTAYIGLALTSHNNSSLCMATFDNVTAPGWPSSLPPSAPTGLVATAGTGQAALSWAGSGTATSYNVKRSTTNGGPYAIFAAVTTTNYTDTGLVNGTTYYYVVSALNPAGESTNSAQASVTPQVFAPTGLSATAVSSNQINLVWNLLTNASSYSVKRSLTNGGPYTTIASGVTATNYPDSGLAGGTIYYYVVSAVLGGNESTNSAQATATTFSPTLGSLVHRYSFSESGGTTVADSVGGPVWAGTLPNGGTLSGGQLTLASGYLQYVSLPAGIVGSLSNVTVMAWVTLTSVSYWSRIFDFGNDTTTYMYLTPRNGFDYTARFAISTSGAAGEQKINCGVAINPGAWHQVVVSLNAGEGVLYVDGVAVGTNSSMTLKPSSLGSTTHNYLGKSQSASDPYLNGSLDEFRIYNVGLSAAEIAATAALGPDQLLSTNPPLMGLALTGTNLTVSWPLANAGFTLQSCTDLTLGDWVNVTWPVPQVMSNQWQVMLPLPGDASSGFYRLSK